MLMAISTKVSGSTIRPREWALTRTPMVPTTRASGWTINNMVTVLNRGQMVLDMRVATKMAKSRAKADLLLQTAATMKVSSS